MKVLKGNVYKVWIRYRNREERYAFSFIMGSGWLAEAIAPRNISEGQHQMAPALFRPVETTRRIEHNLKIAGGNTLLTDEAIKVIHEAAQGAARAIGGLLCSCLLHAISNSIAAREAFMLFPAAISMGLGADRCAIATDDNYGVQISRNYRIMP